MRFIVDESGMSARQISLAMDRNDLYVARAINKGKDVQTSTLSRVCEDGTADAPNPAHLCIEVGGKLYRIVP